MHWGMTACCALMLLPMAGYFIFGGTVYGLGSNALAFAPLVLCVGAHFVMHKMMGKSCHVYARGTAKSAARPENRPEEA